MGAGWQVVQSAKDKKKRAEGKAKSKETVGSTAALDPAGAALAKFDAEWSKQNGGTEPALPTSRRGTTTDGPSFSSNGGAFGGLEVRFSPHPVAHRSGLHEATKITRDVSRTNVFVALDTMVGCEVLMR